MRTYLSPIGLAMVLIALSATADVVYAFDDPAKAGHWVNDSANDWWAAVDNTASGVFTVDYTPPDSPIAELTVDIENSGNFAEGWDASSLSQIACRYVLRNGSADIFRMRLVVQNDAGQRYGHVHSRSDEWEPLQVRQSGAADRRGRGPGYWPLLRPVPQSAAGRHPDNG